MFFGRGANHPSFFLRKFFSYIEDETYSSIYKDYPKIHHQLITKANRIKT